MAIMGMKFLLYTQFMRQVNQSINRLLNTSG